MRKNKRIGILLGCFSTIMPAFGSLFFCCKSSNYSSPLMNTSINSTDKKLEFTGRLLFERVLTNESASGFIEYEAFVVNNKKYLRITNSFDAFCENPNFVEKLTISDEEYELIAIGSHAFDNNTGITGTITFSSSINTIGDYAFNNCANLNGIKFKNGCKTIGDYAFSNCSLLNQSIELPESLKTIGDYAFSNDTKMNLLIGPNYGTFTNNLTYIGDYAFYNCNSISAELDLSKANVEYLGTYAFSKCSSIPILILPYKLKQIKPHTFDQCTSLDGAINFPSSVTSIGDYAFYNCSNAKKIFMYDSITSIGDSAFENCSSLTGWGNNNEFILSKQLSTIGNAAFKNCSSLVSSDLLIPNSVKEIGSEAFYNCSKFQNKLILGNSLVSIGDFAFYNCKGLKGDLYIPSSVNNIGNQAFYNTSFNLDENNILYSKSAKNFNKWCIGMINSSKVTSNLVFDSSTYAIAAGAFKGCNELTNISLEFDPIKQSGVTIICDEAFYDCSLIKQVYIPKSTIRIGSWAFYNTNLSRDTNNIAYTSSGAYYNLWCLGCISSSFSCKSIEFKNETYGIADKAFYNASCSCLGIKIPKTIGYLGNYAFYNCTNVSGGIEFEKDCILTSIGKSAFEKCLNLNEGINFNDAKIESIGDYAFSECENLGSFLPQYNYLSLPSTLKYLGKYAFNKCHSLTGKIELTGDIKKINDYAFSECYRLTSLVLPDNLIEIGDYAFNHCIGLCNSLVLPNTIQTIGKHAFDNCSGFNCELNLPDNLIEIGDYAFNNCSNFDNGIGLNFANSLLFIGDYAFNNCLKINGRLNIGSSVIKIGIGAFSNDSFDSIKFFSINPPLFGANWQPNLVNTEFSRIFVPFLSEVNYFQAGIGFKIEKIEFISITNFSIKKWIYSTNYEKLCDVSGSLEHNFAIEVNPGADERVKWELLSTDNNPLPDWLSINSNGLIEWSNKATEGTYSFKIRASSLLHPEEWNCVSSESITINFINKKNNNNFKWSMVLLPLATSIPTVIAIAISLLIISKIKNKKKSQK